MVMPIRRVPFAPQNWFSRARKNGTWLVHLMAAGLAPSHLVSRSRLMIIWLWPSFLCFDYPKLIDRQNDYLLLLGDINEPLANLTFTVWRLINISLNMTPCRKSKHRTTLADLNKILQSQVLNKGASITQPSVFWPNNLCQSGPSSEGALNYKIKVWPLPLRIEWTSNCWLWGF